jgi:uncharacterized protein (DUF952 family)
MGTTFHLTTQDVWDRQRALTHYTPEMFDVEGFIHCTDGEANVVSVGNRYYTNETRSIICLVIDLAMVGAEVKYEDPERIYPHIFGPLETLAVVAGRGIKRADDGTFLAVL